MPRIKPAPKALPSSPGPPSGRPWCNRLEVLPVTTPHGEQAQITHSASGLAGHFVMPGPAPAQWLYEAVPVYAAPEWLPVAGRRRCRGWRRSGPLPAYWRTCRLRTKPGSVGTDGWRCRV